MCYRQWILHVFWIPCFLDSEFCIAWAVGLSFSKTFALPDLSTEFIVCLILPSGFGVFVGWDLCWSDSMTP